MEWVVCVGLDWAKEKHAFEMRTREGVRSKGSVSSSPEAFHAWIMKVRSSFPNGQILVAVEDGRSSLLDLLSRYPFVTIIRINPLASKRYRESQRLSGSSSDPVDAALICDYALRHLDKLRVWKPSDAQTRKIAALNEQRRSFVDQRTAFINALAATLEGYFPQVIEWLKDVRPNVLWQLIRTWPTLKDLRTADAASLTALMKAHRLRRVAQRVGALQKLIETAVDLTTDATVNEIGALQATTLARLLEVVDEQIAVYDRELAEAWAAHPDHDIFSSLPGAGPCMGPRLAAAFTTDRERFVDANEVQCYSGIAPVREASGKWSDVHARYAFPTFLHQTFHEFAESSLPHCAWARECYRQQRERGLRHHAAIRTVAFKWIRILFRMWKSRTVYDDAVYVAELRRRGSPLAARIAA